MTQDQINFVNMITGYVKQYAPNYGIARACYVAIVAQACIESNWGKSKLGYKYHNYFGMKCGSNWTGKSVNMQTSEEYTPGTYTNISANFRVYDSDAEGVLGYFEFINRSRYANLKTATTPKQYLEYIKADGYATSSTYVNTTYNMVNQINSTVEATLNDTVSPVIPTEKESILTVAVQVVNGYWGNGTERKQRLEEAGYNYNHVQLLVNAILACLAVINKKKK